MKKCNICSGVIRKGYDTKVGTYHKDCLRMQRKGLLYSGYTARFRNSTGSNCAACGQIISSDHFHKAGQPYHKECK